MAVKQKRQDEYLDELEVMSAGQREEYRNKQLAETVENAYKNAPAAKELFGYSRYCPNRYKNGGRPAKAARYPQDGFNRKAEELTRHTAGFWLSPNRKWSASLCHLGLSMSRCSMRASSGLPSLSGRRASGREMSSLIHSLTICLRQAY